MVPEPSVAESLTMLRGIKEKYQVSLTPTPTPTPTPARTPNLHPHVYGQTHHGVYVTDDALVATVEYAHRYLAK